VGTSYAAPVVAHKAARLLAEVPGASPNLLRSLLGAHAKWPAGCEALLNPEDDSEGRERLLQLVGYGRVDDSALFRSLDDVVTLMAEDEIGADQHHFYEVPLPATFWSKGRRLRQISVGLAHSPEVRTTRLDYRMNRLWFTLVTAQNLDSVTAAFRRNREEGMGERTTGRWIPNATRRNATLQVSRWTFKQPARQGEKVFVVVTRQEAPWSTGREAPESYALTIAVEDRENLASTLYADIRAALEAQVQVRARARV
jgi:hypothetical protein